MHMSLYRLVLLAVLLPFSYSSPVFGVTVSSFSPTIGGIGDQVMITGSGFYPGTLVVRFNGVQDPNAHPIAVNGTSIQAFVPSGASNGPISVSINGGAPAFSSEDFTVIGAGPYVTNLFPNTGSANTLVTIEGLHFFTANTTNVYFGNIRGNNFNLQSDNRIQVNAPSGVTNG